MVIDSLISAKVVTAKGDIINASATSNPDLFWAIRGAGSNFGIITSAVYKLTKPVNLGQVFYADLIFSASQKVDYFNAMQKYNDNMPSQLGFSGTFFWNANTKEVSGSNVLRNPLSYYMRYEHMSLRLVQRRAS